MLARCRVHEVSQEWGCEWGSSYMNESIHSVSSHDCRFLRSRMRCSSLVITLGSCSGPQDADFSILPRSALELQIGVPFLVFASSDALYAFLEHTWR